MAAETPAEKKRIMETAGLQLRGLTSMDQTVDWYATFFARLGAVALGQVMMDERKRRDDAKKANQRRHDERAKKILEEQAGPPGYRDQDYINRGQSQTGARGPWNRQNKAYEQAQREIKREDAEGIEYSEDGGERAPKSAPKS